ncbi:MAG: BTAD domain-containing putative transcriptional regulator [Caldilineaceae bacterium]
MAALQIVCFGDFQVTLAGTALSAFQTEKVRALLAYLAVEGRLHQRSELAQFLWAGYSDESARNSLRQAIHQLRQLLATDEAQPPWLLVTRQSVQLNPDAPIAVDVATFTRLLAECTNHTHGAIETCNSCLARLRQATALYQGDFLGDFTVADSDPFEEWRRVVQEQLHIQMLDALAILADGAEAAGDEEGALQVAQRQLALEPWLENAHRQIMRILAQRGQRAAAIAQYNRCRQVLAEEFNAEPDGATLALYQRIVDGRFDTVLRRLSDLAKASVDSAAAALAEDDDERSSSQTEPQQARSSLALPSHYLPASPYAIVGRAEEMSTILTHLQSAQLLTLMGSGGMGKTRLALEIGRQLLSGYVDGVWFVALAAVSSPSAIAMTVATTMGLVLQGNDPNAALCQLLRHKQLLLILDNFEHLLGEETALDLVVDLLAAAPGVQILVTSRERLKLRAEQLYPLSALPFSPASTLAEAAASPAVHLFVLTLQRVQTNFQLPAANLAVVLRICQLVQGMPLGLELAAANSRGMPLSAIADAIAQSADFLGVDWRDLPERQRSMRAVFAWSWRLLSATEQRVLRQSAIFRGSFDYSAAQAVLGAMSAVLTALVDKSLLQWQAAATGEGRYAMHELLRQLAEEQLQAVTEEYAAVATRHSDYYLAFVAAQEQRIVRHELRQATDAIQSEIDNIRQAWRWAATQTNIDVLGAAAYTLWQFYAMRGSRAESEQMLRLATAAGLPSAAFDDQALPQNGQRSLSKLLALHADTLVVQGKYADAAATARQAMTLGRRSNGHEGESYGAAVLGQALTHMNHFDDARPVAAEALHLVQRYTSDSAASALLDQAAWLIYENLAFLTFEAGDYPGARAYMRQSLQRAQARGHQHQERVCLYYLAQYAGNAADYATALPEYEQSLALMRSLGDQLGEAYTLIGVAQACRLQGAYTRAQRVLAQGLELAHQLGDVFCQITALADLSRLHCLLGNAPHVGPWLTQLAQLLAQRELNPGRRLYGLDLLAFHALTIGEGPQSLAYAEEAAHLAQGYIGYGQARALATLGQARAYNQQWAIAQVAYQQAVDGYAKLNNARLAVEPRAGLAQIALAQGDLAQARAWVESFLPVLVSEPRAGFNSPFFAYWVGYQVFAANHDPRAATLLQQGYDLLHQDAAALDDESRQRFLTGVTIHCEIVTAYEGMKETGAGKIRDTRHETGAGGY